MPQERVACVQRATVPGDILTSGFVPAALRLAWVCRLQRPPYQDQPCPRADSHGASTGTMLSRWGSWRQVPPPGVQGGTGEPGQGLAQSTIPSCLQATGWGGPGPQSATHSWASSGHQLLCIAVPGRTILNCPAATKVRIPRLGRKKGRQGPLSPHTCTQEGWMSQGLRQPWPMLSPSHYV